MKQLLYFLLFFFTFQLISSQEESIRKDSISVKTIDTKYKEDQFYLAVTYNVLSKMPENMSQNGFSTGFAFGYIKDIPLNEDRNFGLGLGLGLSSNSYNDNLKISKSNNIYLYEIVDVEDFSKNKFSTQLIEIPLEIRWRTSTPDEYKFWRVYAGIKFGYVLASRSKFIGGSESLKLSNIEAINKFQYGLTLSAGYSTWNFNLYYGLNPIFDDTAIVNDTNIDTRALKIGLIFYFL
ncbi:MAG: PorT family protein [Flavobacteriaceae bacterium]|nr:PorT family protein [Bacteroidia bacterium]NNK81574.1 PorT family protein [Flavobacteriaceae bacterium]